MGTAATEAPKCIHGSEDRGAPDWLPVSPPLLLSSSTSGCAAQAPGSQTRQQAGAPHPTAGRSAAGGYRSCAGGRAPPRPRSARHCHCEYLRSPSLSQVLAEPGSTWPPQRWRAPTSTSQQTCDLWEANLGPVLGTPRPRVLRAWGAVSGTDLGMGGVVNKIPVSMEHHLWSRLQGCMRHIRDLNRSSGKEGPKETLKTRD